MRRGSLLEKTEAVALSAIVLVLFLSTWGPALLTVNGFYVPELLGVPLAGYLVLRRPDIVGSVRRCFLSKIGLLSAFWLVAMAAVGALLGGGLVGPYSELRASLVLVCAFVFMYTRDARQCSRWSARLLLISFSVLCLDFVLGLLQTLIPGFLNLELADSQGVGVFGFGRVSVPAINILVSAYLSASGQRIAVLAGTLMLGGVVSFGGHRVVLFTTGVSAMFVPLSTLTMFLRKGLRHRWLKACLLALFVGLCVAVFRSGVIQDYLLSARGIQYRLFTRTMDTYAGVALGLSGENAVSFGEEGIRAAYVSYLVEEWPSLLLPHGLGSREVQGNIGDRFAAVAARFGVPTEYGGTHDLAILYMAYHHGLLMTGFVIGSMIVIVGRRLRSARNGMDRAFVTVALVGIALIDLAYPPVPGINIACVYGMFMGLLLNPSASKRHPSSGGLLSAST